jgi:hypothetical protein
VEFSLKIETPDANKKGGRTIERKIVFSRDACRVYFEMESCVTPFLSSVFQAALGGSPKREVVSSAWIEGVKAVEFESSDRAIIQTIIVETAEFLWSQVKAEQ